MLQQTIFETPMGSAELLLEVDALRVEFMYPKKKVLRAVHDVSLRLHAGETLGVIGESGSGKSTVARAIMGLERAAGGSIRVVGTNVAGRSRRRGKVRTTDIQMIFQDPHEALDPRLSIRQAISEPLIVQKVFSRSAINERVDELMSKVGLNAYLAERRPHELSGGQRQRVNIARALTLNPKILLCDEAVSALDVSIQAEILNLLVDLQEQDGLAYLFISHDIGIVSRFSDRISVMYLGQTVESAPAAELVSNPRHPYTQALLSAAPQAVPSYARMQERILLSGEIPSPLNPPTGCRFRTRCRFAAEACHTPPELRPIADDHTVACHFAEQFDKSAKGVAPIHPLDQAGSTA